jgi:hypothetical protein
VGLDIKALLDCRHTQVTGATNAPERIARELRTTEDLAVFDAAARRVLIDQLAALNLSAARRPNFGAPRPDKYQLGLF